MPGDYVQVFDGDGERAGFKIDIQAMATDVLMGLELFRMAVSDHQKAQKVPLGHEFPPAQKRAAKVIIHTLHVLRKQRELFTDAEKARKLFSDLIHATLQITEKERDPKLSADGVMLLSTVMKWQGRMGLTH